VLIVLGLGPEASLVVVLVFLLLFAFAAGAAGGLLGLGGGIFVVPMLILVFDLPITLAISTSLVAVIATSCGAASTYVGAGIADIRLGMFLEVATVVGGLLGAILTVYVLANYEQVLLFAFVPAVLVPAYLMIERRDKHSVPHPPPDARADRLHLHGSFPTETGAIRTFRVTGTTPGLFLSGIAGIVSGLLGIGGGVFYVPAMNLFMNIPVRVASGTSNFMIGVTATASALVYLLAGRVALFWTVPIVIGMLIGSRAGTGLQGKVSTYTFKVLFVGVLIFTALLLLLRALGWLTA
jgi:uncharacterized protein